MLPDLTQSQALVEQLHAAVSTLPELLSDPATPWQSKFIDYDYPHIERLWLQRDGYRLYLHRLSPLAENQQPLWHSHPWQSAVLLLRGKYLMYSGNADAVSVATMLHAPSVYVMPDPSHYHAITCTEEVLSVMIAGPVVQRSTAPVPYVPQRELTLAEQLRLRADIRSCLVR